MKKTQYYITQKDIDKFEMIYPLIDTMSKEMKALSLKKPEGVLNTLKIKMINKLIITARELLISQPSLNYLEILDEETLPQNSDVALILSQYVEVLNHFKSERHHWQDGWLVKQKN